MSELHVLAECPCRMTVLHVHAACSVADPDPEFLVLDLVTHNYLNMKKMSPFLSILYQNSKFLLIKINGLPVPT
jgi:hypothetical protein